ncbi:hypothetical protein [Desulfotignum balticum]|uniref:hypothetical protein n=1 Tax=Desulfotignum balticum TaxID=115781 RepID=UPI000462718E|nr:hypothetical protein [Desulfotignum balticum]
MDKQKVYNIIQYALLVAGQEDDFRDRDLGPIHFIKYVYLADLHHAMHNNGKTYTGIQWKFHKFGPWSNDVNDCIAPALDEINATFKPFKSQYEGSDDIKRWFIRDEDLLEKMGVKLPLIISGVVESIVHQFKKDTASLLEHVYRTKPMLKAAPGDVLDFNCVAKTPDQKTEFKSKFDQLSARKQKKFKQAVQAMRKKRLENGVSGRSIYVNSPLPIKYDDVYVNGLEWVESLSGDKFQNQNLEAEFSNDIWYSDNRKGVFSD